MNIKKKIARATYPLRKHLQNGLGLRNYAKNLDGVLTVSQKTKLIPSILVPSTHILLIHGKPDSLRTIQEVLDYGRSLGIQVFISFNTFSVGEKEFFEAQPDTLVINYKPSKKSTLSKVTNAFLHTYCERKWVLQHEWSQRFVFPLMESRSLKDFSSYLTECQKWTLYTPLIDTLLPKNGAENLPLFESIGYSGQGRGEFNNYKITGGLRQRIKKEPVQIGFYGLCKWRKNMTLHSSLKFFLQKEYNHVHLWYPTATGALLNDVSHELSGAEYDLAIKSPTLMPYVSSHSLLESNLLNLGTWK